MSKTKDKETPLMKQYNTIKAKYPDAMLLFRVGDFYETFGADAIRAANVLGITLTARNNGGSKLELAGFPHHSLNTYLPKLVRAGMRVAICDQLEAPSKDKKIVKRGVTELVTPGVTLNDQILDHKSNNFLAAVHFDKKGAGVSFLDVSTGEFLVAQGDVQYIDKLLHGFKPTEVLFQRNYKKQFVENFGEQFYTFCLDDWAFTQDFGQEILNKHFQTASLKGFGIEDLPYAISAAGAALHYLSDTQHDKVQHITSLSRIEEDKYVWLDKFTIRNLELIYSPNENAKTLIDVLDQTISPMGSRMLKRWVALPLKDIQPINDRLTVVSQLVDDVELSDGLKRNINEIGDLERLISKVATSRINPREVVQLKRALSVIEPIKEVCLNPKNESLQKIGDRLNPCVIIRDKIAQQIQDEPPVHINKGGVIAEGVNDDLDGLRKILNSGKDALVEIQEREIENTGIPSLKISFNNVFGYYIEVRNTHKDKVPENWIRKQTLTQAERYITEELKEYESKILGADDKILTLETQLFNDLVLELSDYISPIQLNAQLIAQLDCLLSFATIAKQYNYTKPEVNDTKIIEFKDGRHPVIEQQLAVGDEYVANDIYLDDSTQQIMMITGPNMSGKSALLRQTALITLMAQIGSFVPAKHAKIGLVDKIFTRVGASDNISQGESTFMVEMNETASILNNLSDRSLILLDEIGRGTSTYDGISIAWSIAEYLHEQPKLRAKTLFATHYHELNEMTNAFKRIKNYNVSVKEINNKIIFLRKLVAGGSNHSFGIHVAKMAGMPKKMLNRAHEVLAQLESSHAGQSNNKAIKSEKTEDFQLSFFQLDDPVLENIKDELISIDINTLTPVEALMKLNEIKKMVGGKV
ncbi:DNA mismatch repair protein MutS [Vicingus serpentipes]|uniref:DNA mismatch repair protein MutS n=1 Tax=Vicingus serpentipes TaxID=1926625 RepID=A0A5C6RXB5_9FLAO|nr:DNA mismatch repair protein MutS [Vicingus serpentipes]TXB66951.1 DNA mismatch repair protein MutS [Vicingus serpentipes]